MTMHFALKEEQRTTRKAFLVLLQTVWQVNSGVKLRVERCSKCTNACFPVRWCQVHQKPEEKQKCHITSSTATTITVPRKEESCGLMMKLGCFWILHCNIKWIKFEKMPSDASCPGRVGVHSSRRPAKKVKSSTTGVVRHWSAVA